MDKQLVIRSLPVTIKNNDPRGVPCICSTIEDVGECLSDFFKNNKGANASVNIIGKEGATFFGRIDGEWFTIAMEIEK